MYTAIQKSQIQAIRKNPGLSVQKEILQTCSTLAILSPAILREYHDALLFVMAFPVDKEERLMARAELKRLAQIIRTKKGYAWQRSLAGSGLPGTELRCQYSRHLLRWLLQYCPKQVQPAEAAVSTTVAREIFQVLLPGIEFTGATAGEKNLWKRIYGLSGQYFNREAINWLLNLVEQQPIPLLLKDQLFDRLQIYSSWNLKEEGLNRSTIQWPVEKIQYYTPGKKIQFSSTLKKSIKHEIPLDKNERLRLVAIARASLAFYYRETDPFTYASAEETFLFDMGGGFQIALYSMVKERRLALDSYIGFLAFKNGIPVAYGGGWVFGYRCKIGVNIYPPFRGADSSLLFTQVLRVYYQQFRVHYFLVKPYQFGKGNPEGLKSGAFWFYYKLGFRSADSQLEKLAREEWGRKKQNTGYRSPLQVLKKLTGSPLLLVLKKDGLSVPRASALSSRITSLILGHFGGDRQAALKEAKRLWMDKTGLNLSVFPDIATSMMDDWYLLFLLLADHPFRPKDWKKLARLRFSGPETDFITQWQECRELWARNQ